MMNPSKAYRARSRANLVAAAIAGCAVVAMVPFAAAFDPAFRAGALSGEPVVEHIQMMLDEACLEVLKSVRVLAP